MLAPEQARLECQPHAAPEQTSAVYLVADQAITSRMRIGDLVAVPLSGMRVAIAEVMGDYQYRTGVAEPRLRHVRPVRWHTMGISRSRLSDDICRVANAPGTLCSFKTPDAARKILAAIR